MSKKSQNEAGSSEIDKLKKEISEYKTLCERLKIDEEKFRTIFDSASIGIEFYDKEGKYIQCNPACLEIFGVVDPRELKKFNLFNYPNLTEEHKELLKKGKVLKTELAFDFGKVIENKLYKTTKSGIINLELTISPVKDKKSAIGFVVQVQDISEKIRTLKELEHSKAKSQAILNAIPDLMFLISADGVFLDYNAPKADELYAPPEVFIGKSVDEILPPELAFTTREYIKKALKTGKTQSYEYSLHIGKEIQHFEARMVKCGDDEVLSVIRNITEHKRDRAIIESERERLLVTLRSIGDGVIATNIDGKIVLMNRVAEKLTGWAKEEARGKCLTEVFHIVNEKTLEKCENPVEKVLETGGIVGLANHTMLIAKDGTKRIIADSGSPIQDSEGKIIGVVLVFRDITEKRRVEEALKESEAKFRAFAETSASAIFAYREKFVFVNKAMEAITGYSEKELLDMNFWDIVHPEYRELVKKRGESRLRGENPPSRYEFKIIRKDGEARWIDFAGILIKLEGIPTGLGSAFDITDRKNTEEALRQSEEFLQLQIERMPFGCIIWDTDFRVQKWNPSAERIFGYTKEESFGKKPYGLIVPESARSHVESIWSRLLEGDTTAHSINENNTKDGKIIICEWNNTPLRKEGKVIGVLSMVQDITEKRKAEEALKFEREQLLSIFDSIAEVIYISDPNTYEIVYTNKYLRDLFGKDPTGKKCYKEFQNLDTPCNFCTNEIILNNNRQPYLWEYHNPSLNRDYFIIDKIISWPDGRDLRLEFAIDITEKKNFERELSNEKERLIVTLRSIGDGVISTDINGNIMLMNKVAEKLTGWTNEEAQNKPLSEVFNIIDEKTRIPRENPVDKVLQKGISIGLANNTVLVSRDGTERVIADSAAPIRDKNSEIIGVVLVFRDITIERKLRDEVLKTQKLESIGTLAGGIAHDFNNILTGILGNVAIAKMNLKPGTESFELLRESENAALQARNLTQQLLTFSRGGTPIRKPVSIREILERTVPFALRGTVSSCEFNIQSDLWLAMIDEGQIQQVINNLVLNASQAMPRGGIVSIGARNLQISANNPLSLKAGKYIEISVKDTGIGIPKENLPMIFDPYFTTKQKGSGLGLAVCHSIVKNHDGAISVESELGKGSTFYCYIPAFEGETNYTKGEEGKIIDKHIKLLVMDDEEIVLKPTRLMLKSLGYDVDFARDGASAVEMFKKAYELGDPYKMVILDLTVPGGIGGKEAVIQLKEIDPSVRAIVSSGYSTDPIMSDYKNYGFSGVIIKPYNIEELSEAIKRALES